MYARIARTLSCLLVVWLLLGAKAAEPTYKLVVVTDRPEALYMAGEKVKFVVTLSKKGEPIDAAEIAYALSKDGMPPVSEGKLSLKKGQATVEGTLAEPGFLQCRVTCSIDGKRVAQSLAGAGFDPLKIPPSMPVPDDFDAFWRQQTARLAAVPMKPEMVPVKSPVEAVECFDVKVPCVAPRPVSGYFCRPAGASLKSLPAILSVHGAGVRGSILDGPAKAARQFNALAMDINAHGIVNGQPPAFYKDLADGDLKDYRYAGRESREQCYFLGMFLRLIRAMDFLTSQPEWDGKVLIVRGSSQGGGQAIAAAGLNPRVSFISAGVPAICDHSGKAIARINGWPKLVPDQDGKPDAKILEVARYFDGMNFATRCKAEAIFSVGFIDVTCPPTAVYATYNNLPGKKQMVNEPLMGHAHSAKLGKETDRLIAEHIARAKNAK